MVWWEREKRGDIEFSKEVGKVTFNLCHIFDYIDFPLRFL